MPRRVDRLELCAHLEAELRVQVRERFVEQEDDRLANERTTHRHALALTTGELARTAVHEISEAEQAGDVIDAALDLRFRGLALAQPEREVLLHRHVRVQRVVLEHHRDVAVLRRHVVDHAIADADRSRADLLDPGHQPERGGLPTARRPYENEELPVGDVQREPLERDHCSGIHLRHIFEYDAGHLSLPLQPLGGDATNEEPLRKQEEDEQRQHRHQVRGGE